MKEEHSSAGVATKTGKKHQGERNDQEKIKNKQPSEEFLNQYASQADGCDSKFDRETHSEQNVDLYNVKKSTTIMKCPPLFSRKMTDIILQ